MSSIEKFEVSNLDILRVILDVFILNHVEGGINKNDAINKKEKNKDLLKHTKYFNYIIFLYENDKKNFMQIFLQIYKNLKLLKNIADYKTNISQHLLYPLISKGLDNYSQYNDKKYFEIDLNRFFIDNFEIKGTDGNAIRIKKKGFIYLIKLTPYIILLTSILNKGIDEYNIGNIKKQIIEYSPDISKLGNILTFNISDHIDENVAEYIKLNKWIFNLEKKVVYKIEEFQKKHNNDNTAIRISFFDSYNKYIDNVIIGIPLPKGSSNDPYSTYMNSARAKLIDYLNELFIEEVSDTMEKQAKDVYDDTKNTLQEKLQLAIPSVTNALSEPSASAREPPIEQTDLLISSPEVQKKQEDPASEAVKVEERPNSTTYELDEEIKLLKKKPEIIEQLIQSQTASAEENNYTLYQNSKTSAQRETTRPQTAPAIQRIEASPDRVTTHKSSSTRLRVIKSIPPGSLNMEPNNKEGEGEKVREEDEEKVSEEEEEDEEGGRGRGRGRGRGDREGDKGEGDKGEGDKGEGDKGEGDKGEGEEGEGEEGDEEEDEEDDTQKQPNEEKNINSDPLLPYNEEELKQKYLYTQKYKDGIDEAELKKLLELKSDNSDNLYNNQYSNNKIVQLSSYIDIFNNKRISGGDATREDKEDIIAKLKGFENDPKNPIDALEIKFEDRLVFIIATFFIRYVAISMIQRGIDINLITTFYDGFIYYGCIYLVLFWFVVLFINIDDKYTTKYIDTSGFINYIRSLFYYFYMGTNGISRLLIHSLLLIVIIIIPIILNIKNKNNINTKDDTGDTDTEPIVMLTLEERTKLSKLLSVFTLFIWILTSIIATKF